jgi:hypothetical protein
LCPLVTQGLPFRKRATFMSKISRRENALHAFIVPERATGKCDLHHLFHKIEALRLNCHKSCKDTAHIVAAASSAMTAHKPLSIQKNLTATVPQLSKSVNNIHKMSHKRIYMIKKIPPNLNRLGGKISRRMAKICRLLIKGDETPGLQTKP